MLKIQGVNKNSGGKSAGGKTFINVNFTAFYAFKLVNYSRHSEILNSRKNSKSTSFSFENSDFTVFKFVQYIRMVYVVKGFILVVSIVTLPKNGQVMTSFLQLRIHSSALKLRKLLSILIP